MHGYSPPVLHMLQGISWILNWKMDPKVFFSSYECSVCGYLAEEGSLTAAAPNIGTR